MSVQVLDIVWENISIEISYNSNWSNAYCDIYGHAMGNLEIRSNAGERLPITDTGYRSLFIPVLTIEEQGGPITLIQGWLDEASQSEEWKTYVESNKQLSLF
ncbi:MAG: hypothetical protein R2824_24055 [Saprospiraceae bacterium]|nr:hypothetical protein [Lewinella sp.]